MKFDKKLVIAIAIVCVIGALGYGLIQRTWRAKYSTARGARKRLF